MDLDLVIQCAEVVFAATIALFLYTYSVLAPWWRNPVGRTIAWKSIVLLYLLAGSVGYYFFGLSVTVSRWIFASGLVAGAGVMVWRTAVFIHERYKLLIADPEDVRAYHLRLAEEAGHLTPPMPRTLMPFVRVARVAARWWRAVFPPGR